MTEYTKEMETVDYHLMLALEELVKKRYEWCRHTTESEEGRHELRLCLKKREEYTDAIEYMFTLVVNKKIEWMMRQVMERYDKQRQPWHR